MEKFNSKRKAAEATGSVAATELAQVAGKRARKRGFRLDLQMEASDQVATNIQLAKDEQLQPQQQKQLPSMPDLDDDEPIICASKEQKHKRKSKSKSKSKPKMEMEKEKEIKTVKKKIKKSKISKKERQQLELKLLEQLHTSFLLTKRRQESIEQNRKKMAKERETANGQKEGEEAEAEAEADGGKEAAATGETSTKYKSRWFNQKKRILDQWQRENN